MIRGNLRIPPYLAQTFEPFVVGNYWPERETDQARDLIEEGDYDAAEAIIADVERRFGPSTETVMLSTRISRIQILASHHTWRDELVNRYRAIRGVSLFRHPYMVGGCLHYKHGLRLTLVKLRFIFVTLVRGV